MAEGRGRAPPRPLLLLVALALLSAPPGSAFALRRRAGLLGSPGELSNSAESRVFQIGRSIRLEHPVGLRRPLQWLTDAENAEIKGGGSVSASAITSPQVSPPPHHRRHQKSLGDTWNRRGNPQGYGATAALAASPESPPAPSPPPVPRSASSGPRRRLRAHEACFNVNEVLLIIGVTCAVNFAFILLVLALVHFCNRGASKTYTSSECEWLEELQRGGPGGAEAALADGAYERVREYVDSLPDPRRPAPFEDDEGALGPPRRRRSDPHGVRGACSMEELLFRN